MSVLLQGSDWAVRGQCCNWGVWGGQHGTVCWVLRRHGVLRGGERGVYVGPVPSLDTVCVGSAAADRPPAPQRHLRSPGGAVPPSPSRCWVRSYDSALRSPGSFPRCSSSCPGREEPMAAKRGRRIEPIGALPPLSAIDPLGASPRARAVGAGAAIPVLSVRCWEPAAARAEVTARRGEARCLRTGCEGRGGGGEAAHASEKRWRLKLGQVEPNRS